MSWSLNKHFFGVGVPSTRVASEVFRFKVLDEETHSQLSWARRWSNKQRHGWNQSWKEVGSLKLQVWCQEKTCPICLGFGPSRGLATRKLHLVTNSKTHTKAECWCWTNFESPSASISHFLGLILYQGVLWTSFEVSTADPGEYCWGQTSLMHQYPRRLSLQAMANGAPLRGARLKWSLSSS